MPEHVVDEMRQVGYRVEVIRTRSLQDVADGIAPHRRADRTRGRSQCGGRRISRRPAGLAATLCRGAAPISVFYQVYERPLYTINGEHYVSELIELCGGANIFADLDALAPAISVEAVIERDPEVMLASSDAGADAFGEWRRWPGLRALQSGNQYLMPADSIGRGTPRLLDAGHAVCTALQAARQKRDAG